MSVRSVQLLRIAAFVLPAVFAVSAFSQTMTNNGTIFYMAPKAIVSVKGSAKVKSAGIVTVQDSATLTVDGSLDIVNGSVSMNGASLVSVNGNLSTDGLCSQPAGVVVRNSPGLLSVTGSFINKGLLTNSSTVTIGTSLRNDGEVNNSKNALIETGQ
jgi:hypothetical protein